MGEGVDPTQMCRSLVEKMSRFEQLQVIADPELLVLFEDWLEELEDELVSVAQEQGITDPAQVAKKLRLPASAITFLVAKLKQEGRLV